MSGLLDHSPEDIIRNLLVELELGVVPEYKKGTAAGQPPVYIGEPWPVFASGEPDSPDSAITVYSTQGSALGRHQLEGDQVDDYGIQVRVRAAQQSVGYRKLNEICIALDRQVRRYAITIGSAGYLIHCINRTSGPLALGRESPASSRRLFTANMLVALEKT